jgi:hypothetical protein
MAQFDPSKAASIAETIRLRSEADTLRVENNHLRSENRELRAEVASLKAKAPPEPRLVWSRGADVAQPVDRGLDAGLGIALLAAGLADQRIAPHFAEFAADTISIFDRGEISEARQHVIDTWLDAVARTGFGASRFARAQGPRPNRAEVMEVMRAVGKARGKIVDLPTDAFARATIAAHRKARGERDPEGAA